ncbi:MAG: tRNA threonylcarbamoyladenosine biosynthesis protein TsaE [Candidatus Endobugula sp.]|jgi:tRNA threonylcarbamoyladenosine biosynthesis protein TsaE
MNDSLPSSSGTSTHVTRTQWLADEAATVIAGQQIATQLKPGMTVFLEGTLGAGKTTITRGILNALGYSGAVKSPTYTLVEPYEQLVPVVYHFDLYRLGHPEELEYMGIRDYFSAECICLVEWAERGQGVLPQPDIVVRLVPKICEITQVVGREITVITSSAQA